jgi:hypothetical protein
LLWHSSTWKLIFIKHITTNFAFTYIQCSQIKVSSCIVDNTVTKIICVGIQNAGLFFSSGYLISLPGFLLLGSCHVQRMVFSHNPVSNSAYIRPWGPNRCMHIHTHTLSCSLCLYLNTGLFQNSITKLTCSLAAVYWTHWHFICGITQKHRSYKFDSCSATSTENYHLLYVKWTPIGFILHDFQLIVTISSQDIKNVMEWCPIYWWHVACRQLHFCMYAVW